MASPKLMFFELDGATWTVMKPLLEKGELPHIQKLMDRGAHGILMSESPSISPKIWTGIFSGKRPDKHGVAFFGANSKMVRAKRIWDILEDRGYTVGVFGSLVTWPPYKVNGFMVPSVDALGTETYPEEYGFFQKLALSERKKWKETAGPVLALWDNVDLAGKLLKHGINPRTFLNAVRCVLREKVVKRGLLDRYWRKVFLHLELATDFLEFLLEKHRPDFCTWHIHTCDSVAHRYWAFYEPEPFQGEVTERQIKAMGDVIPDSYRVADRAIGRIMDRLDNDTTIVLVSDHGGRALPEAINPFSPKEDLLLDLLGLTGKVVVARFGPGYYLHFKEKDQDLIELTEKRVREAHFVETGDEFAFIKRDGNTLLVGKPNRRVKAEQITDESTVSFGDLGQFKVKEILRRQPMQMSGTHDDEGVIIMAGPQIKKGAVLDRPSVYDMTPTVLTLLGEAVGRDMDGKVIEDAFEPAFLDEPGIRYIDTYEDGSFDDRSEDEDVDHEKLKERLQHLGYL